MNKTIKVIISLALLSMIVGSYIYGDTQVSPRGKYVYDDAKMFSIESRAMLSSLFLRIDTTSHYEFVIATNDNTLTTDQMVAWFNQNGVGKRGLDNGAVLFIFPKSNTYFVAIGSGNDVVTVTQTSTQGKAVLSKLDSDPTLAIVSYIKIFDSQFQKKIQPVTVGGGAEDFVINNGWLITMWGGVFILIALIVSELKFGLNKEDLVVPIIIGMILVVIFAGSVFTVQSRQDGATVSTYGIITSTHHTGPIPFEVCTHTGKTTVCVTHFHYYNDVTFLSYDLNKYSYRYVSTDSQLAWTHYSVNLIQHLTVHPKGNTLVGTDDINDNSGGKTIGDGTGGTYK